MTKHYTDHKCHICGQILELKEGDRYVLNGFQDMDTGQICHFDTRCKSTHYEIKSQGPYANLYSETPLTVITLNYE